MVVEESRYEIIYPGTVDEWRDAFKIIEKAGRVSTQRDYKIEDNSYSEFLSQLKNRGHTAVFEFANMTVRFITDRGIANELVRHRLCSFVQESTRYCNYADNERGSGLTVIRPLHIRPETDKYATWYTQMLQCESTYNLLLAQGTSPQTARAVLPLCLKTELIMSANLREWQHIFNLRVTGTTGAPHPDMVNLLEPLYEELKEMHPWFWGDVC